MILKYPMRILCALSLVGLGTGYRCTRLDASAGSDANGNEIQQAELSHLLFRSLLITAGMTASAAEIISGPSKTTVTSKSPA